MVESSGNLNIDNRTARLIQKLYELRRQRANLGGQNIRILPFLFVLLNSGFSQLTALGHQISHVELGIRTNSHTRIRVTRDCCDENRTKEPYAQVHLRLPD